MAKILRKLIFSTSNTFQALRAMSASEAVPSIQSGYSYHDCIAHLNSLQSNAQTRAMIAANRDTKKLRNLPETMLNLEAIGISKSDLESLNTIHVTGTKGKGTTCAFTESILRQAGLRTGLYSSPHLVVVRERIRINGVPISPEKFAKYFSPVFSRLATRKEQDPEYPMPAYFRFLTCLAFYVFLKEKVDVAIFEVGIGGRYDSTNVIPKPTVVGITSLGMDHQSLLGNTLEEIAWNKAGILKPGCPAFTLYNHEDSVTKVLQDCAREVNCPLSVVPKLSESGEKLRLGVDDGKVSEMNAALAIQLATSFLRQKFPQQLPSDFIKLKSSVTEPCTLLSPAHINGLRNTEWLGRFQKFRTTERLQFYLDGAHTRESLTVALKWFKTSSVKTSFRVLIFNVTGDRQSDLVVPFAQSRLFDMAIFCPVIRRRTSKDNDNWNALSQGVDIISICKRHCDKWKGESSSPGIVVDSVDAAIDLAYGLCDSPSSTQESQVIDNANFINGNKGYENVEVLVTGSLHLVGNVLSVLNPSLCDDHLSL